MSSLLANLSPLVRRDPNCRVIQELIPMPMSSEAGNQRAAWAARKLMSIIANDSGHDLNLYEEEALEYAAATLLTFVALSDPSYSDEAADARECAAEAAHTGS